VYRKKATNVRPALADLQTDRPDWGMKLRFANRRSSTPISEIIMVTYRTTRYARGRRHQGNHTSIESYLTTGLSRFGPQRPKKFRDSMLDKYLFVCNFKFNCEMITSATNNIAHQP